jgi:hypothetical protein
MNQTVIFWKQWIALQLKHNVDKMCELSIKNFHFPGLNYVCFEFSPTQTIRLYIVEPVDNLDTTNVNIHNHLYDSQLLVLRGSITNTTYKVDNEKDDYNIYALTSALCPTNLEKKIKLRLVTRRGLKVDTVKTLNPGDMHFQPHTEIHNVANDPANLTAFMVFEFPTVKENSRIFTKQDFGDTIPTPNCYLRYTPTEMRSLVGNMLSTL